MIEILLKLFKNVKKGIVTTLVGSLLMSFGGYLIYVSEKEITLTSVELVLLLIGVVLLVSPDDDEDSTD